jgi:hypothetical protein
MKPFMPSLALRSVAKRACHSGDAWGYCWRYLAPASGGFGFATIAHSHVVAYGIPSLDHANPRGPREYRCAETRVVLLDLFDSSFNYSDCQTERQSRHRERLCAARVGDLNPILQLRRHVR